MDLKSVVASYANKAEGKVEIDLKALAQDSEAQKLFVEAVLNSITSKQGVCLFIPVCGRTNQLGPFVNELALNLKRGSLVVGSVEKLKSAFLRCVPIKEVVLIQQMFGDEDYLAEQIALIKATGRKVSVICLVAQSKEVMAAFAAKWNVNVEAYVYTEEI